MFILFSSVSFKKPGFFDFHLVFPLLSKPLPSHPHPVFFLPMSPPSPPVLSHPHEFFVPPPSPLPLFPDLLLPYFFLCQFSFLDGECIPNFYEPSFILCAFGPCFFWGVYLSPHVSLPPRFKCLPRFGSFSLQGPAFTRLPSCRPLEGSPGTTKRISVPAAALHVIRASSSSPILIGAIAGPFTPGVSRTFRPFLPIK